MVFFRDNLGIQEIQCQISDQEYLSAVTGFKSASLKIGFIRFSGDSFPLEIIEYTHPKGKPSNGGIGIVGTAHLCFEVSNLDALYKTLLKKGVKFYSEPHKEKHELWGFLKNIFFAGPNDILFEFTEKEGNKNAKMDVIRIHHIGLTVSNLEAAKNFLSGKLKLNSVYGGEEYFDNLFNKKEYSGHKIKTNILSIPGTSSFIELWQFEKPFGPSADTTHNNYGSVHLCFQVNDIFTDHAELEKIGIQFVGPPAEVTSGINSGAHAIYFYGFDGFRFELFQRPPRNN